MITKRNVSNTKPTKNLMGRNFNNEARKAKSISNRRPIESRNNKRESSKKNSNEQGECLLVNYPQEESSGGRLDQQDHTSLHV